MATYLGFGKFKVDYKNDLINLSAKAIMKAFYLQGIKQLIPYTPCKVIAFQDKLQIRASDSSHIRVNLDYKRIIEFKYLECTETPSGVPPIEGYIAIRYIIDSGFHDILFSLPIPYRTEAGDYNALSLKTKNIFDYVQTKISPRKPQVIDL